jgi:uncharacterized phiE125 gp8 family phage protein
MSHPIRLTEAEPGAEPLTLDEVKTFLRVDHDRDDVHISGLIGVARQLCEKSTGRSLITRSCSLFLDCLEERTLALPRPPLQSVTAITVYDADDSGADLPEGDYFVDTAGTPGRIVLTEGAAMPVPGRIANGIEIKFRAGYGATPQSVPPLLKQGMRQVIAHLYEHRGDSPDQALLASGAAAIFQPFRVMSLA